MAILLTAGSVVRLVDGLREERSLAERALRLEMLEQTLEQARAAQDASAAESGLWTRSLQAVRTTLAGWNELEAMRGPALDNLALAVEAELTRAARLMEGAGATHGPQQVEDQAGRGAAPDRPGASRQPAAACLARARSEVRRVALGVESRLAQGRVGLAVHRRRIRLGLWVLAVLGIAVVALTLAEVPRRVATRRRALENALLAGAIRAIGEGIVINTTGDRRSPPTITFVNRTFSCMIGLDADQLLGRPLDVLRRHHLSEGELSVLDASVGDVHSFTMETVARRPDGSELLCEWHVSPVRDARGRITHFISAIRDVTERRSQEEALERSAAEIRDANLRLRQRQLRLIEAERMVHLGQLFTGLAHEIEGPFATAVSRMTALRARLDSLRAAVAHLDRLIRAVAASDDATTRQLVGDLGVLSHLRTERSLRQIPEGFSELAGAAADVARALELASGIINELKACSDLHGTPERPLDLNQLVDEALRRVRARLSERITVRTRLGDLPLLEGRPRDLCQTITILLLHAARQVADHGEIVIESGLDGEHAMLRVHDSGPGIPQERLPELFLPQTLDPEGAPLLTEPLPDPFGPGPAPAPGKSPATRAGKVPVSGSPRQPGATAGRSLVVALACVRAHHGTLQVRSEPERGTTLTMRLPLSAGSAASAPRPQASQPPAGGGPGGSASGRGSERSGGTPADRDEGPDDQGPDDQDTGEAGCVTASVLGG